MELEFNKDVAEELKNAIISLEQKSHEACTEFVRALDKVLTNHEDISVLCDEFFNEKVDKYEL